MKGRHKGLNMIAGSDQKKQEEPLNSKTKS